MKYITWLFRIVMLTILVVFATQNTANVPFSMPFLLESSLPLWVLLSIFFLLGLVFGVLLLLPKYVALRWNSRKMRKEIDSTKTASTNTTNTTNTINTTETSDAGAPQVM